MKRLFLLFVLWGVLLVGCGSGEQTVTAVPTQSATPTAVPPTPIPPTPTILATPASPLPQGSNGLPWWNDTVFYEVFVRSFKDSDGDGIGDLNGLIEMLDYLNDGDPTTGDDLGVTGIWLMPIMVSPSYHGYDVVDYYLVNPEYGTNEDFQRLVEEAHKRGIRVIVDLVLNHTGRDHPWFVESRDPNSERRDWYVWSDTDPGYAGPWGQPVWHRTPNGYYYGVFWDGMPDLNLENPDVTAEMLAAAGFWLEEMGADGFRLDAIKHLIEDGRVQENTPATHAWLQEFYTFYKEINPDAFAVGEAWTTTREVLDYTGDEVDIAFQFDLAEDILNSVKRGNGTAVASRLNSITAAYPRGQYATFLANHDQNRVMSQLIGNEDRAKIAASILLTSPGVPFVYYGEEIGLMGAKPDEDIRRPMQWTSDNIKTGFTTGSPWRRPGSDYETRSVALQTDDPNSLLNHYRQLIQLRATNEALRVGDWLEVQSSPNRVYAFLRYTGDETVLVVINMSNQIVEDYTLNLASGPLAAGATAVLLFGDGDVTNPTVNAAGGFNDYIPLAELPPFSTFVIDLTP
ncbi:MAG TPA: alpha-amylase family glycosyl hydrolase [Chloroflexota bacterium]|nr:alpha-amylase family glycosyl hydrolase [Chloroflexota bacterium]